MSYLIVFVVLLATANASPLGKKGKYYKNSSPHHIDNPELCGSHEYDHSHDHSNREKLPSSMYHDSFEFGTNDMVDDELDQILFPVSLSAELKKEDAHLEAHEVTSGPPQKSPFGIGDFGVVHGKPAPKTPTRRPVHTHHSKRKRHHRHGKHHRGHLTDGDSHESSNINVNINTNTMRTTNDDDYPDKKKDISKQKHRKSPKKNSKSKTPNTDSKAPANTKQISMHDNVSDSTLDNVSDSTHSADARITEMPTTHRSVKIVTSPVPEVNVTKSNEKNPKKASKPKNKEAHRTSTETAALKEDSENPADDHSSTSTTTEKPTKIQLQSQDTIKKKESKGKKVPKKEATTQLPLDSPDETTHEDESTTKGKAEVENSLTEVLSDDRNNSSKVKDKQSLNIKDESSETQQEKKEAKPMGTAVNDANDLEKSKVDEKNTTGDGENKPKQVSTGSRSLRNNRLTRLYKNRDQGHFNDEHRKSAKVPSHRKKVKNNGDQTPEEREAILGLSLEDLTDDIGRSKKKDLGRRSNSDGNKRRSSATQSPSRKTKKTFVKNPEAQEERLEGDFKDPAESTDEKDETRKRLGFGLHHFLHRHKTPTEKPKEESNDESTSKPDSHKTKTTSSKKSDESLDSSEQDTTKASIEHQRVHKHPTRKVTTEKVPADRNLGSKSHIDSKDNDNENVNDNDDHLEPAASRRSLHTNSNSNININTKTAEHDRSNRNQRRHRDHQDRSHRRNTKPLRSKKKLENMTLDDDVPPED